MLLDSNRCGLFDRLSRKCHARDREFRNPFCLRGHPHRTLIGHTDGAGRILREHQCAALPIRPHTDTRPRDDDRIADECILRLRYKRYDGLGLRLTRVLHLRLSRLLRRLLLARYSRE